MNLIKRLNSLDLVNFNKPLNSIIILLSMILIWITHYNILSGILNIYTFPIFIVLTLSLTLSIKHKMITALGIIFMVVLLDKFVSMKSKKTVLISEEHNIEIPPPFQEIFIEEPPIVVEDVPPRVNKRYCIDTQLTRDGLFQLPLEENPRNKEIMDIIVNDSLFDNLLEVEFTKRWLEKYPLFQQLNFIHGTTDTFNQIIRFYQ